MEVRLDYVATFTIEVGSPIDAGMGHRLVPVLGGAVCGARLKGRILGGGADWQNSGPDESLYIGGRWVMETEDGARIQVETPGIRRATAEILSELAGGHEVDPTLYYFRVAPRFTVAEQEYRWLQHSLFLGLGAKRPGGVEIEVYAVA